MAQCTGTNANGQRCQRPPVKGEPVCRTHKAQHAHAQRVIRSAEEHAERATRLAAIDQKGRS